MYGTEIIKIWLKYVYIWSSLSVWERTVCTKVYKLARLHGVTNPTEDCSPRPVIRDKTGAASYLSIPQLIHRFTESEWM
jgi:hypothetical protein